MKGFKSRKAFADYIRELDRLRWEYLRESDKYRKDWELCKEICNKENLEEYEWEKKQACSECEKTPCINCEYQYPPSEITCVYLSGEINSYHIKSKKAPPSIRTKMWLQYGINLISDPDLDYGKVIAMHPVKDADKKLIFYMSFDEYGIYEGVYGHVNYKESPFIHLTVNASLKASLLVDEFKRIISEKKKQFNNIDKNKLISKKWVLPPNVHLDTLQERLEYYRRKKYEKKSYRSIAYELVWQTRKESHSVLSLTRKHVLEAQKTIKRVEQGFFP